jgi:hypothetical protein
MGNGEPLPLVLGGLPISAFPFRPSHNLFHNRAEFTFWRGAPSMSFAISLPVNDVRDRQVIHVPGYGRCRLTHKWYYPIERMTYRLYEKDDDPPGDRISLQEEEPYPVATDGPDWTTLQVSDGPELFVWADTEPAPCEEPGEGVHARARC